MATYKSEIYAAQNGEKSPLPHSGVVSAKLRFALLRYIGAALTAGDVVLLGKLGRGIRVQSHLSYLLSATGGAEVAAGAKVQAVEADGTSRDVTTATAAKVSAGALGMFAASTAATVVPTTGTDVQLTAATGATDVTVVLAYIEGEDG
jgi:hypothetical protein